MHLNSFVLVNDILVTCIILQVSRLLADCQAATQKRRHDEFSKTARQLEQESWMFAAKDECWNFNITSD